MTLQVCLCWHVIRHMLTEILLLNTFPPLDMPLQSTRVTDLGRRKAASERELMKAETSTIETPCNIAQRV